MVGTAATIRMVALGLALLALGGCRATAGSDLKVIKTGDNYKILAGAPAQKTDKLSGKLILEVQASGKWKFEDKAPILIDLFPPEKLNMSKTKLRKQDAAKPGVNTRRFEVTFQAASRGSHDLKLKFDFVICTDTLCQKKRFELTYKLPAG